MSDISVVMGSKSDWPTVKETCDILNEFGVSYEKNVISAHRMPNEMFAFAQNAVDNGVKVIIACAGGAAHLPGMCAALFSMPVIGIPMKTSDLELGSQDRQKLLVAWTRFYRLFKCRREFRWQLLRLEKQALKTLHY